jgi:hypothetical protein
MTFAKYERSSFVLPDWKVSDELKKSFVTWPTNKVIGKKGEKQKQTKNDDFSKNVDFSKKNCGYPAICPTVSFEVDDIKLFRCPIYTLSQ